MNVSNIIDMKWMNDSRFNGKIKAVAYVWSGGMEGGNPVVDVLSGKETPSGKLPDTIAENLEDVLAGIKVKYMQFKKLKKK